MTNALAIYSQWEQIQSASIALYKSGLFKDVTSEAQAMVKVMAGAEIGIPPFASMSGINVIQGKPVLGGNIIATLIKNSGRYDYRIKSHDLEHCTISFFENGQHVGDSTYDKRDAEAAGLLSKDNWRKYTKAMYFNRAISQGARWYTPGIFGGAPVYTAEEMGMETDEDGYIDGKFIDKPTVEITPTSQKAEAPKQTSKPEAAKDPTANGKKPARPLDPDTLRSTLVAKAEKYNTAGTKASELNRKNALANLDTLFYGNEESILTWIWFMFDLVSTVEFTDGHILALLDWMHPTQDSGGAWVIDKDADTEARQSLSSAMLEKAAVNA